MVMVGGGGGEYARSRHPLQEELQGWHALVHTRTNLGESLISDLFEGYSQPATRCTPCGQARTLRFEAWDAVLFQLPEPATVPGGTVSLTELLRQRTSRQVVTPPLREPCHDRTTSCPVCYS